MGTADCPISYNPSKNHCNDAVSSRSSISTNIPRNTGNDANNKPNNTAITGG